MTIVVEEPVAALLRAAGRKPVDDALLRRLLEANRLPANVRQAVE
jgi:hypothetical protein